MSTAERILSAPRTIVAALGSAVNSATAALKAFRFGPGAGSLGWGLGVRVLWHQLLKDAGSARSQGESSSLIQACILWIQRTFPEAPLQVVRLLDDGGEEVVRTHPLAQLVARPNPYYSGILLWMGTLADWVLDGNAYWIKERATRNDRLPGTPIRLWWVPSSLIEPKWPEDGKQFVTHYEYNPGGGDPIKVAVQDVVHFRYGLDANTRKGISPLRSLLLELFTDAEAARFTGALLKNLGIPGVILAPASDKDTLTPADAEAIKTNYQQKFSGDRRGEPMIMTAPTSMQVLSFNPQQMEMGNLRDLPEERVSAVLGIPAIVVGFGAGLARSTFANFAEAREAAYESNIIPSQRLFSEELSTQLLDDFPDSEQYEVRFDLSKVRVLQDDQNALHLRAREDLKAGLTTLNQSLAMISLPQEPGGDIRYIPGSVLPTPAGEEVPEPVEALPEPTPLLALPAAELDEEPIPLALAAGMGTRHPLEWPTRVQLRTNQPRERNGRWAGISSLSEPAGMAGANELGTDQAADSYGMAHGEDAEDLSEDETDALQEYQAIGYLHMNPMLRGRAGVERTAAQTAKLEKERNHIDDVLDRSKLKESVIVYRGVDTNAFPGGSVDQKLVGSVLHERGYLSTALGTAAPKKFGKKQVIMRIRVPKGAPAFYMGKVAELPSLRAEHELLVARDAKLLIHSVAKRKRPPGWDVDAEIVGGME